MRPTLFFIISIIFFSFLTLYPTDTQTIEQRCNALSKQEMQSVIEFLGDDLLEGRAPGTRGGNLAEIYIKSLFKWLDLKPGFQGQYFQPFTLKGFTIKELNLEAEKISLQYTQDIVGSWVGPEDQFQMEKDSVFVCFGIATDLWQWDDYKDIDVKDKIVICRVNDPGMFIKDIFEGTALTYFGRWIYHIEEAVRRGAAGILLIHTPETAGYGWNVVVNSLSGEEVYRPADIENNLKFRCWIQESSLVKILKQRNINLEDLYAQSLKRSFKPVPLGFKVKVKGSCTRREVLNHNVIAEIPGKSPQKIVLSAHIDHLGKNPNQEGDNIFNGAIDNGSAVAAMMM